MVAPTDTLVSSGTTTPMPSTGPYQHRSFSSPILASHHTEDPTWASSSATEGTITSPSTPCEDENDQGGEDSVAVFSAETSPSEATFGTLRQREVDAEYGANALMYQKTPFRRRRSSARPRQPPPPPAPISFDSFAPREPVSLASMLPWTTNYVPTRKISCSSAVSRPDVRRSMTATTLCGKLLVGDPSRPGTPTMLSPAFEGLQRRPSQLSVRMRRESVAEKVKSQQNRANWALQGDSQTYRSSIHASPGGDSQRSHWSPDASEAESSSDDDSDGEQEDEDVVAQFGTARRVSRSDSMMLPIFLKASRAVNGGSGGCSNHHLRRTSNLSLLSKVSAVDASGSNKGDLVRLVTALQSSHLDETRRLNEIIATLSVRVASLERDLVHAQRGEGGGGQTVTAPTFSSSVSVNRNKATTTPTKRQESESEFANEELEVEEGGRYALGSAEPTMTPFSPSSSSTTAAAAAAAYHLSASPRSKTFPTLHAPHLNANLNATMVSGGAGHHLDVPLRWKPSFLPDVHDTSSSLSSSSRRLSTLSISQSPRMVPIHYI